jgi:cyclopropane fatty-acyl-phospholipid synthase-like methyltransferase
MKPFSQSSEENKEPILAVLREAFVAQRRVLEIGSGTGQHAVYFARQLPHLFWQPSELAENLPGIHAWLAEAGLPNVATPLLLDVERQPWPDSAADAVFSANTVHIISWPQVEALFAGIGALLPAGGVFALYGPFNYDGRFTSDSNARFDQWLKARDPLSGVRDFEAVDALARAAGMTLTRDYTMPANNRTLVWHKTA